MSRSFWRSLRTRIILIAIVTCAFLTVATVSLFNFLRSSHTATIRGEQQRLVRVAANLAQAYGIQVSTGTSLRHVSPPPKPPEPPLLPTRLAGQEPPPPPPPADPLSQITAAVLQREDGIEGGYLAGAGPLVGYAFPTHEGPGAQKEMPQRERPTIDLLAHQAEATGTAQTFVFEGPHDVVLFYAQPIREMASGQNTVTGAVWLMRRLPDLNGGRSKDLLFGTIGFGSAALITALLAWFLIVEIEGGVHAVTHHLALLEQDLSYAGHVLEKPQLTEFEELLSRVDAMAASLRYRIANERHLEDQLRHKERLSSLGQFAAGVAHELRNPLATIRLRAQMALQASAESTVVRSSTVILEEVDRLNAMIGRLLYFSRPTSLNMQSIDLGELCSSVAVAWQRRIPDGFTVLCQATPGSFARGDRSSLLQVLDNLIENAVQASRSGAGQVIIRVEHHGKMLNIDVLDSGTGFDETALIHAFDPFFTTKDSGTGLGLSIAFELIEAHGGRMKAATRPEGGAIVSVVLPFSTPAEEDVS